LRLGALALGVLVLAALLALLLQSGAHDDGPAPSSPRAAPGATGAARSVGTINERAPAARQSSAPSAALVGRVIDSTRGHGVRRMQLHVTHADSLEQITCDEQGRFRSELLYPLDTALAIVLVDELSGRARGDAVGHAGDPALTLAVNVGPTLELDLGELVLDVNASARVHIRERAPGRSERRWAPLAVRDYPGSPWVRWPHQQYAPDPQYDAELLLSTSDKSATGRARLRATAGVHPGRVHVEISSLADLAGRVVDASGTPLRFARVTLAPLARGAEDFMRWKEFLSDPDGEFVASGLHAGAWRVSVSYETCPTQELLVELGPGENELVLELPTQAIAGDLCGVVVNDPGMPSPRVLVELTGQSTGIARWLVLGVRATGERSRPPELELPFCFKDLPIDRYRVELHPLHGVAYAPRSQVGLVGDELRFVADQTRELVDYRFELPAQLEQRELHVLREHDGRWQADGDRLGSANELWRRLPSDARFRYVARMHGFRPIEGDQRDFTLNAGARIARLEFEPGWGLALRVRDASFLRRHPSAASYPGLEAELAPGLADARILADGELIAHTDASGYALVSLAEAPRLLEATLAGWRIIGGDDWERGRVFDGRHEVVLWMDRE